MVDKQFEKLIKKERQAYFRAWRAANPEKVKRHNQNYWAKRAQKRLEQQAEEGKNNDSES
jgi:hypothetical protein